jgi:hypothetical protein
MNTVASSWHRAPAPYLVSARLTCAHTTRRRHKHEDCKEASIMIPTLVVVQHNRILSAHLVILHIVRPDRTGPDFKSR